MSRKRNGAKSFRFCTILVSWRLKWLRRKMYLPSTVVLKLVNIVVNSIDFLVRRLHSGCFVLVLYSVRGQIRHGCVILHLTPKCYVAALFGVSRTIGSDKKSANASHGNNLATHTLKCFLHSLIIESSACICVGGCFFGRDHQGWRENVKCHLEWSRARVTVGPRHSLNKDHMRVLDGKKKDIKSTSISQLPLETVTYCEMKVFALSFFLFRSASHS